MGGTTCYIEAPTKTELRKSVQQWIRSMKDADWAIRADYAPDRVEKTKDGYRIRVSAHT